MIDTKKFKTQTFYKEKNNGQLASMWPIGIDMGYSSCKIYAPNCAAMFPNFAVRLKEKPRLFGNADDSWILYHDLKNDNYWLVGDAAHKHILQDGITISDEAVFGRARYDDPMFVVIVETGLGIALMSNKYGTPKGKTIHVQTGLPPKYLKEDSKPLKDTFSGEHYFSLQIGSMPEKEFRFTIQKPHVEIMEQPLGTLFSVTTDNQGHTKLDYFQKNGLIFDAGFRTLDLFPIVNKQAGEKETLPEYGMISIFEDTIKKIYEEYEQEISLVGMQQCLTNGMVRIHQKFSSEDKPFQAFLEDANNRICNDAIEKLGQIYPLYNYDYLIVTGGTGAAWNDTIHEKLKGLKTLEVLNGNTNEPSMPFSMANVRGYYMYLQVRLKSLEKK